MLFRKKPVEVEAVQMASRDGDFTLAPDWLKEAMERGDVAHAKEGDLFFVYTPEGLMKGEVGDYVIRGIEGELYPCKRSVFEKTHERA